MRRSWLIGLFVFITGCGGGGSGSSTGPQAKWTLLVYMNAANDLYPDSDLNINQMESLPDRSDVNIIVQWKQSKDVFPGSSFDGVRRYKIRHDSDPSKVTSPVLASNLADSAGSALDMGSATTLRDFVDWGKANFPAQRTALIVWNHGNGWNKAPEGALSRGVSYDDQYGSHIDTWQLRQALGSNSLDLVAWDASLMQMAEVAFELRTIARFIVGSEESPPAEGYPYDIVLKPFLSSPDASTPVLARGFVEGMTGYPLYANRKITQSVIDASRLEDVARSLSALGAALSSNRTPMAIVVSRARNNAQSYSPSLGRYYRDLADVCRILEADTATVDAVRMAAANVRIAVANAVVVEGHNSFSPGSHGLAIDFSPGNTFQSYADDYGKLQLAKDTLWDEFLSFAPN